MGVMRRKTGAYPFSPLEGLKVAQGETQDQLKALALAAVNSNFEPSLRCVNALEDWEDEV